MFRLLTAWAFLYWTSFEFLSNAETYSGNATWYDLGSTACGVNYTNSDLVVAVSTTFWNNSADPNPNHDHICTKYIQVRDPHNSSVNPLTVKVVDKCGGCDEGDLDLSPTAFEHFYPTDKGLFEILWEFIEVTNKTEEIVEELNVYELDYYTEEQWKEIELEFNKLDALEKT
ncbi:Papain inhibitor [Orchesella cincta]|uniref:Papain inhibitor n=1 Tax=Orchesella cincta TaxID=48709 RepID=A0A1D2MQ15_ORCCI|nr:Papain inhibitor [Orchesella cincta]